MEQMEKVEFLREKTGCSYSEAKAALDSAGDDLLEALCWLETHGKTQMAGASCSTANQTPPEPPKAETEPGPFSRGFRDLWDGIVALFRWLNRHELVMKNKQGGRELGVPLILLLLFLIPAFWLMVVLIVIALFCGFRFSLEGPSATDSINDAMGKATDFAAGIKDDLFPKED